MGQDNEIWLEIKSWESVKQNVAKHKGIKHNVVWLNRNTGKHWTTLNRLRNGVGRYRASMKKWRLAVGAACELATT